MSLDEFSLIERIRARTSGRSDIALGIGDDAALLEMPPGQQLVVTADTLNSGIHFPAETPPADIGWKALAVNLSDLAAMGAQPAWCTLALTLPQADADWVEAFADGFFALADQHNIALVGGDTTRGPLSISITAMGWVPAGAALRRDGARPGDDVWLSGIPGEAAAALQLWQGGAMAVTHVCPDSRMEELRQRLLRPTPRLELGRRLRGLASACADVSDGLMADLGHICERSGVAAAIALDRLPVSAALSAWGNPAQRTQAQLAGGDDYELCFTAPAALREQIGLALEFAGVLGTCIGHITAGAGVTLVTAADEHFTLRRKGFNHFER